MKIQILNSDSKARIPKARLEKLCLRLFQYFKKDRSLKRAISKNKDEFSDLVLVFLPETKARALNKTYRKKNYATDILSFSPSVPGQGLGELVLCAKVLKRQASEHNVLMRKELDYMIIHGFLHLLGFDHEKSRQEELKMTALQDKLFKLLSEK
jgi:probable rRNA maturation factor